MEKEYYYMHPKTLQLSELIKHKMATHMKPQPIKPNKHIDRNLATSLIQNLIKQIIIITGNSNKAKKKTNHPSKRNEND
jgi:hypothetical protein